MARRAKLHPASERRPPERRFIPTSRCLVIVLLFAFGGARAQSDDFNISIALEHRENSGYFMKLPIGSESYDVLIDTGSTVGILLPENVRIALEKEGWLGQSDGIVDITLAHGHKLRVAIYWVKVSFGGCTAHGVDLIFTNNQKDDYGIIGYTVLQKFAPYAIHIKPPDYKLHLTCKK